MFQLCALALYEPHHLNAVTGRLTALKGSAMYSAGRHVCMHVDLGAGVHVDLRWCHGDDSVVKGALRYAVGKSAAHSVVTCHAGCRFFVEFGVETGVECTTRHLREAGWTGLMMDGGNFRPEINLQQEFFTAEGIAYQFRKHAVPQRFDHLTIDIDQNTFWVLHAILYAGYRPRVIVAEINRNFHPDDTYVTPYLHNKMWDGSVMFGASAGAFDALFEAFGYHVVGIDQDQINTYAVHSCDVGEDRLFSKRTIASGLKRLGPCPGIHGCLNGLWLQVDDVVQGLLTQERQKWVDRMPAWQLACCDPPSPGQGVRLMTGAPVVGGVTPQVQCMPTEMHGHDACAPVASVAAAVERAQQGGA